MSLWSSSLGTWNATRAASFCHASLKSVTLRSNIKCQSFVQFPKQVWETISADEAIQTNSIDKRRQLIEVIGAGQMQSSQESKMPSRWTMPRRT
jgi:hypothetical protein